MEKHTSGPWKIEFSRTGVEWPTILAPREPHYDDNSEYIVCEVGESYPIGEETPQKELALANAALIAAAPELLEALEALLDADLYADAEGIWSIRNSDTKDGEVAVKLARAAIAKATPPSAPADKE